MLIAHWKLTEDILDSSGMSNNLTGTCSFPMDYGLGERTAYLNGSTDKLVSEITIRDNTDYTIVADIKLTKNSYRKCMIGAWGAIGLKNNSGDGSDPKLCLVSWADDMFTTRGIDPFNWVRYICHFDKTSGKKRIYVNNMLVQESVYDLSKWADPEDRKLSLGGYFKTANYAEDYCEMSIKNVKVYTDINLLDLKPLTKTSIIGRRPLVHATMSDWDSVELKSGGTITSSLVDFLENDLFPQTTLGNTHISDNATNGSRINIPLDNNLKNQYFVNFSLGIWIRPDQRTIDISNRDKLILETYNLAEGRVFRVLITSGNRIAVSLSNGVMIVSKLPITSRWYHIAVNVFKGRIQLIINGNLDNEIEYPASDTFVKRLLFGDFMSLLATDGNFDAPGANSNQRYQYFGLVKDLEIYEFTRDISDIKKDIDRFITGKCDNDYTIAHYPLDGSLRNIINPSKPMRTDKLIATLNTPVLFEYGSGPLGKCLKVGNTPIFSDLRFNEWPESDYFLGYDKPLSFSLWMYKEGIPDPTNNANGCRFNFFRNTGSWPHTNNGMWIDSTDDYRVRLETHSGTKTSNIVLTANKWCFYYFYLDRAKGLHIYVDGIYKDTIVCDTRNEFLSGDYQTFIGGLHHTVTAKYANYKFYNRRLTNEEIDKEMNVELISFGAEDRFEQQRNILPDTFKDVELEVKETQDPAIWDPSLHSEAIVPGMNWSSGSNGGVPQPGIGYHAVTYRCCDQIYHIYRNINSQIDPALNRRWLGIANFGSSVNIHGYPLIPNKFYTISMDIMSDAPRTGVTCGFYHNKTNDSNNSFWSGKSNVTPIEKINEWHRVSYTFKTVAELHTYYAMYIYGNECDEGTSLIKNVCMVAGERASNKLVFKKYVEEKTHSLYNIGIFTDNSPVVKHEDNSILFRNRDGYNNFLEVVGFKHPEHFTYSVWVRTKDYGYVVAGVNQYTQTEGLAIDADGTVCYRSYQSVNSETVYDRKWGSSKTKVNDGKWHHIALTYDGRYLCTYVDGNRESRIEININFKFLYSNSRSNRYRLGSNNMDPSGEFYKRAFNGEIKNFKLYGVALSWSYISNQLIKFKHMTISPSGNLTLNTTTKDTVYKNNELMKLRNFQNNTDYKLTKLNKNSWIQTAKRQDAYTHYFFLEEAILPGETVNISFDVYPLRTISGTSNDIDIFFFDFERYIIAHHFNVGGFKEGVSRTINMEYTNTVGRTIRFMRTDVNVNKEVYIFSNFKITHSCTEYPEETEVIKFKNKVDTNILSLKGWNNGFTGSVGNFSTLADSLDDPGKRILTKNPWGELDIAWSSVYNSANGNGDGGWNCTLPFTNPDILNSYVMRYSVWVKIENLTNLSTNNGNKLYFGCMNSSPESIITVGGVLDGNPYFAMDNYINYVDRWVLWVSYVFPNSWDTPTIDAFNSREPAGSYDTLGNKIGTCSVYKLAPSVNAIRHRAYLYYAEEPAVHAYFYKPRIDIVGLNEPSLKAIASGTDSGLVKDISCPAKEYFIETREEADGSIWGKVFYHKPLGGTVLVNSIQRMLRSNDENFKSCLYLLDSCRDEDDRYEFKLEYGGLDGCNHWSQTSNPIYSNVVEKYKAISISWSSADSYDFIGLSMPKIDYTHSFLCGSSAGWWWSIGAKVKYSSEEAGIPGPFNGAKFTDVSLWIKIKSKNVTIGKNKLVVRDIFYK